MSITSLSLSQKKPTQTDFIHCSRKDDAFRTFIQASIGGRYGWLEIIASLASASASGPMELYLKTVERFPLSSISRPALNGKNPKIASTALSARIDELEQALKSLSKEVASDEAARKKLLAVAKEQTMVLESPVEVIWRMIMEPHQHASLRTAIEMKLADCIVSSSGPVTASELAKITKSDKLLIVRIMRPLTAMKVFREVGFETYTSTPLSKFLSEPSVAGGYKFMFDQAGKACNHMPQFLSQKSYTNPTGPNGCFQSAFNTPLPLFPWLMSHPAQIVNFNDTMISQRFSRVEWYSFVPAQSLILDGWKEDTALLIDIGGNRGNDLQGFKTKFPEVKGLVLQDLPEVIESIEELDEGVERMKHDFFTPQPVIGARAYYLRYILHDHSDALCHTILSHIVAAMEQGYSKLLIYEYILPDVGAPLEPSLLDINMLALLGGMERTETQWKKLLGNARLEVVKCWFDGDRGREGVIEAVLARET